MGALPQCGHTRLHNKCAHCVALQTQWYLRLGLAGFKDAENTSVASRPLKAWTGCSLYSPPREGEDSVDLIDMVVSQPPGGPLQSAFPDTPLANKQRLLHHPDFDALCTSVCGHGNHRLTPQHVRDIWEAYVAGGTNRSIAESLNLNDTLVWRTIRSMTEWLELMDLEEPSQAQPLSKIILRGFNPKTDEAFVYASWRNSLWYDDEERKEGDSDRFYRQATHTIRIILQNPDTKVRIACAADCDAFIVGYSVITNGRLHFVYVKADYRNKRIGSLLVPKGAESVSAVLTKIGRVIAIKRGFVRA